VIIGRLIPAGTGLPRYRSLEPATPEGEQIIIEPPQREDRMILPVDVDESLSPVGSNFAETSEKAEEPAPALGARSADDLLRALFEAPLGEEELSESELDEGDDDTLSPVEELPAEIEIPDEIVEGEAEES
jgi:hypothetical protein